MSIKYVLCALAFLPSLACAVPDLRFQANPSPGQSSLPTEVVTLTNNLTGTVNNVLDNVRDLDQLLEATIISGIVNEEPDVRSIDGLSIDLDSLSVLFSHNGTNITAGAKNIGFIFDNIRAKGVPFLCSTVRFDAELENFSFSGNYNRNTGDITNIQLDYRVDIFNSSCSGILGFVSNLLGLDSLLIHPLIRSEVQKSVNDLSDDLLGDSMFSLKQFVTDITGRPLGNIGRKGFETLKTFVNSATRRGIELEFKVDRLRDRILMLAGQKRPFVTVERASRSTWIFNHGNDDIDAIDVYTSYSSGQLHFRGTFPGGSGRLNGCDDGATYHIFARQEIAPGIELISKPSVILGPDCSPDIEISI